MADLQPTSPVIVDPDTDASVDSERAALARAAALARRERDTTDTWIRAALARAAHKRATAALSPPVNDIIPDDTGVDSTAQFFVALLQHEADALLNLHAQAVAEQNIRALGPLLLDVNSTFYSRWRESFLLTLTKFSLECHVLSDAVHHSPDWIPMNHVALTWINGTITDNLADTISEHGTTARVLWLAIESQFLGNHTTRTLYADQAFRSFTQAIFLLLSTATATKSLSRIFATLASRFPTRLLSSTSSTASTNTFKRSVFTFVAPLLSPLFCRSLMILLSRNSP
jgi:hypothetical protein